VCVHAPVAHRQLQESQVTRLHAQFVRNLVSVLTHGRDLPIGVNAQPFAADGYCLARLGLGFGWQAGWRLSRSPLVLSPTIRVPSSSMHEVLSMQMLEGILPALLGL
jgi:hypothetical protein